MASARMTQLLLATRNPFAVAPAFVPTSSITGALLKPGCVEPSIVTGSVRIGSALAGTMANGPDAMLNAIVSAPAPALASSIAWRSEPAPALLVLVTVKVAERAPTGTAIKATTSSFLANIFILIFGC